METGVLVHCLTLLRSQRQIIKSTKGYIFQYDSGITAVSYLSRNIEVNGRAFRFRKIRGEVLVNTTGINRQPDHVNIASAERAFLDLLYLNTEYYFDNLSPLNKKTLFKLLPMYQSNALSGRAKKIL